MVDKATISDIPEIVQIKIEMFNESGHENFLADNPKQLISKTYKMLYGTDKACHFIIKEKSRIVACAGGFIKSDIPYCFMKTPFYGFIGDVYTIPSERNKGYATLLTKHVISWFSSKGITQIRLLASSRGRKLYENLGFVITEEMLLEL